MDKQYKSTKTRLRTRLFRTTFWVVMVLLLSTTLSSLYSPLASAYNSNGDLYVKLVVSDGILPPDTLAGNYATTITYETIVRSLAYNWLLITIIVLVTIGFCIWAVWLVRCHLKRTGLKSTDTNSQPHSSTKSEGQHLNIELDPNTEIINVAKLLKKHKAKRILLQITPVLALSLIGLSASWAIIQSYAITLSSDPTGLTCTPAQAPSSCTKFLNDSEQNSLIINLVKSGGTGTVTVTGQAKVLLQNIEDVTGSMDLQAHLAEDLPDDKISSIKLGDSANLTTGTPLVSATRTDSGVNAQDGNIEVSLTVDKSITSGNYLIKIATILVPDTLQTFDKTASVYSSITPVNGASTEQARNNATITLPDARDNKLYRIRKFTTHENNPSAPDTTTAWWWMIDNLAFDLANNPYAPTFDPVVEHITGEQGTPAVNTQAQYVTTGGYLTADMGYLYNWCAATADMSTACADSRSATGNVAMPNSICPAGTDAYWKLPASNSDANLNDSAWLSGLMNGDTTASTAHGAPYTANWFPTGVWQGSLSGHFIGIVLYQGNDGYYQSSTASSTHSNYWLGFQLPSHVITTGSDGKGYGYAVRCVI